MRKRGGGSSGGTEGGKAHTSFNDIRFIQTLDLDITQNRARASAERDEESSNRIAQSRLQGRTHRQHGLLNHITKEPYGGPCKKRCFVCGHHFDTPKCGLPVFRDEARDVYYGEQIMCDWPCVIRYNRSICKDKHKLQEREEWIREIASGAPWHYEGTIKASPNRAMLKCYGGSLSIKTYRLIGKSDITVNVTMPSDTMQYTFIAMPPAFEVQDKNEKDTTTLRHTLYRELFDKHLSKEALEESRGKQQGPAVVVSKDPEAMQLLLEKEDNMVPPSKRTKRAPSKKIIKTASTVVAATQTTTTTTTTASADAPLPRRRRNNLMQFIAQQEQEQDQ